MRIVEQSVELLSITSDAEKLIERAGRTCYKSEDKMTDTSSKKFIEHILKNGHLSVIEHANATFKIITDRGISHEIVRHRLASYSQESTRYCAYKDYIEVILPYGIKKDTPEYKIWKETMLLIEKNYIELLKLGVKPQNARDILPNCLKTELVMTANFREWLHLIKLRSNNRAHPKIRIITEYIRSTLEYYSKTIFSKKALNLIKGV